MVVNSGSCWQAISFGLSGPPEVHLNVSPAEERGRVGGGG